MGLVAWIATIFSILYLIWAIRNDVRCFVFGIISSSFWAYESYFHLHLKFDAGLQIFYVVMSLIGIYRWKYGGKFENEKPITRLTSTQQTAIILAGVVASLIFVALGRYIEVISYPVLDAITTVFLIIGTLLLVERKLYSWIYLVVCDLVYIYIYSMQSAWLFVGMMIIFTLFGLVGFWNWRKLANKVGHTECTP